MRFVCPRCGATAEADPRVWRCCACGAALELAEAPISLDERLEGDGVWRYSPWLGIDRGVSLGEPTTPLVQVDWHGAAVTLKLEGALPTGSFKDRGAAVLVTLLRDSSVRHVADDSSGNAGAALAAYCARAGIACDIYAPAAASAAKLAQIAFYGARTITVPGARSAATDALLEASADGLVYASHSWSPLYLAGTQTFAFELWEQLGRRAPAVVVAPVGGGSLLLGIHRGFRALRAADAIDRMPRLVGVQAAACAPLARAVAEGSSEPVAVEVLPSVAEGIMRADPERGASVLAAVHETAGTVVSVDEAEIVAAHRGLARRGIFVEPTSATAMAALGAVELGPNDEVVVAMTGNGLKSPPP